MFLKCPSMSTSFVHPDPQSPEKEMKKRKKKYPLVVAFSRPFQSSSVSYLISVVLCADKYSLLSASMLSSSAINDGSREKP